MSDCLFCKIIAKEIPAKMVYEDANILAFRDIDPKAPTHILVIPRRHVEKLSDLKPDDAALAGELVMAAVKIAALEGLGDGFRLVVNNGKSAGQHVFHIHFHLIGGKPLGWSPA